MFCTSCGNQISDDEKFCRFCGKPTNVIKSDDSAAAPAGEAAVGASSAMPGPKPESVQPGAPEGVAPKPTYAQPVGQAVPTPPPPYGATPPGYGGAGAPGYGAAVPKPKKPPILLICIIGVVVLGIIGAGIYYFFGNKKGWNSSFLVSHGVNTDDLGNIMNGQYYFDDGTDQYYASFDPSCAAHIYKVSKGKTTPETIFDGFGWSLVPYNGWLYFSGNEGQKIDATYNLFRMKTDGSNLENINSNYCYGMNIYDNHLYFISSPSKDSEESDIYRSDLDGKNQTAVVTGQIYTFIIYEKKLYYADSNDDLYCADDDGKNAKVISSEGVYDFFFGNGKIVYENSNGDIKVMDIDGKNPKLVRAAGDKPLGALNSYKDTIYYAVYDEEEVEGTYANPYELYSIKFDGTDNKLLYNSMSYGIYVNILNDKVYVLDYAMDPNTGNMPAIARSMDLDGGNVQDLYR